MSLLSCMTVLVALLPSASGVQNSARPDPKVMPAQPMFAVATPAHGVTCRIGVDMQHRRLEVHSVFRGPSGVEAQRSQSLELSHWPTRVLLYDREHLVVAGRRTNGNTVIEMLEVKWPEVRPAPPDGQDLHPKVFTDVALGGALELYDGSAAGRDSVIGLARMFGAPGSEPALMVYFHGSKTLQRVEIGAVLARQPGAEAVWTVLAAPTATPGALLAPALADPDRHEWFGVHHANLGFVYSLRNPTDDGPTLVFIDADRDRKFETSVLMSEQDWVAAGLDDPALVLPASF